MKQFRHCATNVVRQVFVITTTVIQMLSLLNPLCTNGFFLLVRYNKLGTVNCIYGGVRGYNFQNKIVILSLKIVFVLENSVDPDEMLHYAAFLLGPNCLPKFSFWSYQYTKDQILLVIGQ